MTRSMRCLSVMVMALMVSAVCLQAQDLKLNRYFTDNMVIQRDKPVVIKGTADKGAEVTVTFGGQKKSGKADAEGVWSVTLDPMPANAKPQKLTATLGTEALAKAARHLSLENILIGDVFVHARQTSIDITLGRDKEGQQAASSHKKDPMFRVISIKAVLSAKPLNDLDKDATSGWGIVDTDAALKMTASAFYLGRDLATASDVPIGIIDVNLGSAFANSWLSRETLMETGRIDGSETAARQAEKYEKILEAELKGEKLRERDAAAPANTMHHPLFPYAGYNGTLHPLAGTGLKAVVVQLGNDYPYMRYEEIRRETPGDREALNDAYVLIYDLRKVGFAMEPAVVPRIKSEWRKVLGDEKLPFGLIVPPGSDLNTYGQHNREMRELQRLTAEADPNAGIILPGTKHIAFSGQPADEALLAKRCLNWLEGAVYEKPGVSATGPLFDRFEAEFNEATIYFKEGSAKGLKAEGDALAYFEAANVEGDYYPVKAKIDGEMIRIESDIVSRITRVRYNWKQKPNQGLVNAAGLPAIPFRSESTEYEWFVRNEENDLPEEYFMPANEWPKNDVTLINAALEGRGYDNFSGWIGPAGFKAGPFGPNMGVSEITVGSPADGKLVQGDVIYSANGTMLGDKAWEVMAAAITESETREGAGKLVLGVRRGAMNMDVELTLEVMGRYSSTAPYDCPKTEKIVANLEKWLAETGGGDSKGRSDFLGSDSLFLLASGNPEYLGLARRAVYRMIESKEIAEAIDPTKEPKAWYPAWNSLLIGEYYMATGDRNVLPYLQFQCDLLAAKQHEAGAWRHNYPGGDGYGLMPALGEAAAIGFHLANDAGLDISQEAYRKVIKYFHDGSGEMGRIIYGVGASNNAKPPEFEPEKIKNGRMATHNGSLGSAAVLFDLEAKTKAAHLCSLICCHAWNNTFEGHGGNFWNNFWTPLGARVQGTKSYIEFWKNYRWYRECNRMFDGGLIHKQSGDTGAGTGIALVVPRKRIQIVGAPPSPFEKVAPEILKPALEAYWKKDYALAAKIVNELIAGGSVRLDDMPTVEYLARAAREIPESIEADLLRIRKLIDAGDLWGAKGFLAGVAGVLPDGDARVAALQTQLADVKPPPKAKDKSKEAGTQEKLRQWECLVMDNQVKDPKKIQRVRKGPIITSQRETPNLWKLEVLEDIRVAPDGWYKPKFDDAGWLETELPISWHMYHTALLRTTFNVDDKKRFDALRLDAWVLRQQGVEIYLNGELIAKINGVGSTCDATFVLKDSALKHLKNGENTLAISTRHNWRWGMAFMKVYNDGFDFNLDARVKEE